MDSMLHPRTTPCTYALMECVSYTVKKNASRLGSCRRPSHLSHLHHPLAMAGAQVNDTLDIPYADSSSAATQRQSPICVICQTQAAIYTCPRCNLRTCSLSCSTNHKTLGEGCSGIRNKAAYVPMNQYGYMSLMNDYTFLEEVGRKIGEVGREIVQGGYATSNGHSANGRGRGDGRGRGRGRGRGGAATQGKPTSKRDVLKMQLDFRDIEIEFLPNGMEKRTLNQSTWDFKYAHVLNLRDVQKPKYIRISLLSHQESDRAPDGRVQVPSPAEPACPHANPRPAVHSACTSDHTRDVSSECDTDTCHRAE